MGTNIKPQDGLELLRDDHRRVKALIERFERLGENGAANVKEEVAKRISAEVLLHARLEESTLYPIAREAIDADDLVDEALVEHEAVEQLIVKLKGMDAHDPMFDATVKVLGEQLQHHIEEEERDLFPLLASSGMDLEALGDELATRREEFLADADSLFGPVKLMLQEIFRPSDRASP